MTEITARSDTIVIVVDAHCGLCAGGARWLAHHDRREQFRIVPMQTALGQSLLRRHGLDPYDPASWLFLENGKPLFGFEAWVRVGEIVGGSARLLRLLMVIPTRLRERLYYAMARNRIRLFGRDNLCHMPDPEVARRLVQ